MLSRALRVGPTVDGQPWLCHCEAVVAPYPQPLIDEVINFPRSQDIKFEGCRIDVDPPKDVMDKLALHPVLRARLRRRRLHESGVQHALRRS